ncbi:MAG: hypothetical protein IJW28_04750, partial [Clostridia bacterium]|nr:hypothetical protein [Clostridia bacterium]
EWNWNKNKGIKPETIQISSHKKVWWICSKGHEWQSVVASRTGKQKCGCPYCVGQKIISGVNDLLTLYPNIAKEWDYEKNIITPDNVMPNSNKKYWWRCKVCNFSWETNPTHRVRGRGCPKCGRNITIASHFKKCLCVETGVIYNSYKEASLDLNINQSALSNCCRGVTKTAGGYHWKYVEDKKD